jgi:hypothetical protein
MAAATNGQPVPVGMIASAPMTRRTFLKRLSIGAGAVAVVGGGGLAWRVVDQGVLATGAGPAYDAWHVSLTGDGPLSLVRAAILAANAHDTQPWRFNVTADRIDLFADRTRTIGAVDPIGRELEVSLGCALENLMLAAPANGLTPTLTILPDPSEPDHVAQVALTAGPTSISPIFETIPRRHTDRAAYDVAKAVERRELDELARLADVDSVSLMWLDTDPARDRFAELTVRATEALIADPDQSRDGATRPAARVRRQRNAPSFASMPAS